MTEERAKAQAFLGRLLQNPTLKGYVPLQKEEQINQFLTLNTSTLYPTLSSPAFFPGASQRNIDRLLRRELKNMIDEDMKEKLDSAIKQEINFSFVSFLPRATATDQQIKDQTTGFIHSLLNKRAARRTMSSSYAAMAFKMADRYIDAVYIRRKYIHFELTKVEKLKMSQEEVKQFLKLNLLLRPAIYCMEDDDPDLNLPGPQANGTLVKNNFIEQVLPVLRKQLRLIPEAVIKSSLDSSVSFWENRFIEATSRLTAIFSIRCYNYKPIRVIDRGAESSDKSWFNIARKNYKYFGFDIKMLDELHNIAAENGW